MQKHTNIYLKYFGYGEQDYIPCEVCLRRCVDIHHIEYKGVGGSKNKDLIENLIGLCRTCHNKAHAEKLSKDKLRRVHLHFMENFEKILRQLGV